MQHTNRLYSLDRIDQIGGLASEKRPISPQMSVNIKPNISIRYTSPSNQLIVKTEPI